MDNGDHNGTTGGERERNRAGQYVETVTPAAVLDAVRESPDPIVTAPEIGETVGCSSEAARRKLTQLHEQGRVHRRTVSANAVVWWLAESQAGAETDGETAVNRDTPLAPRARVESPDQQLKQLSKALSEPIAVGERVFEDGDVHALDETDDTGNREQGEHKEC